MKNNPQTTHPEIFKCTVLRRNGLSVFHLSPCRRLNISFESGAKKALRQWIHQTEVKRHLQILVIKSYPEATKPTSPSKILHHPHKPHPPHTPIFPIFTQYPEELGSRGEKTKPCACTVRLLLYLAELWKTRQKSQGQMQGKGCALGSSAGCSHVPQQSRCNSRAACARGAMNP